MAGGSPDLVLTLLEGGTLVGLARETTTFGHLAATMMPPVRFATGLGMHTMIQDVSFAWADVVDGERS